MKSFIRVRHSEVGFHNWPTALPEVDFLKNRHRHIFHFTLTFKVGHQNRQKEYFMVKQTLLQFLSSYYGHSLYGIEFGDRSCEMIAEEIFDHFTGAWGDIVEVEVGEDGENSSIVIE